MGSKKIDELLRELEEKRKAPVSIKNGGGIYVYANDGWGEMAEATAHSITSKRDDQLPWGSISTPFIQWLDAQAREKGVFRNIDCRPQFRGQYWATYTTEKLYVPDEQIIISVVEPSTDNEFCQLANKVTENGIVWANQVLSVRQLYLLHQLLFHIPHKQTAKELGCSTSRISQHLDELRETFEADDNTELMCALSANGLLPLLEQLHLLFRHRWISPDLKHH